MVLSALRVQCEITGQPLRRSGSVAPSTPFAALQFLSDYGIQIGSTSREYLNVACPFCHGSSTSPTPLGFHVSRGSVVCWRCGSHPLAEAIHQLTGASYKEAREIIQDYGFHAAPTVRRTASGIRTCPLPGGPLTKPFREYLEGRGLDPDWLALEYGVLAAGDRELWKGEDQKWPGQWFSHRLIIPIHDRLGTVVNFQGRSILPDAKIRYKGAQVDKVPVHHKHTLYGAKTTGSDFVVVVEGVVDRWKLGRGSVATFGTTLTVHQLRELSRYRRAMFAFDSEPEAQAKAIRYARELAALGKVAEVVDLELGDRDLGDLGEGDIAAVRRELGMG